MLGVFLLPAFTCLRHEYQDVLSPYDGMHVCTPIRKSFGGMESEAMEKFPLPEGQRRIEPATLHHAEQRALTLPTELSRPPANLSDRTSLSQGI